MTIREVVIFLFTVGVLWAVLSSLENDRIQ